MSSSNLKELQNQPPAAKKPRLTADDTSGEETHAAVPSEAAAASADSSANTNAVNRPSNHDAVAQLREEMIKIREEMVSKEDFNNLKTRVDYLVDAFEPATQFALFETATFSFLEKLTLPPAISSSPMDKRKVWQAVVQLCGHVLNKFLFPETDSLPLDYTGPRKGRFGILKTGDWTRSLLLHGLAGLTVFIQNETADSLQQYSRQERHNLAHNGEFLDAMFSTPPRRGTATGPTYSAKKRQVNGARTVYTEAASRDSMPADINAAVTRVVDAAYLKGYTVGGELKKQICQELELATRQSV